MDRTFYLSSSSFHGYSHRMVVLCLTCCLSVSVASATGATSRWRRTWWGVEGRAVVVAPTEVVVAPTEVAVALVVVLEHSAVVLWDAFLKQMDGNGNGRLDENEIPERMRGMMQSQGLDLSKGVSFDDFNNARDKMVAQFRGGAGGGPRDRRWRRTGRGGGAVFVEDSAIEIGIMIPMTNHPMTMIRAHASHSICPSRSTREIPIATDRWASTNGVAGAGVHLASSSIWTVMETDFSLRAKSLLSSAYLMILATIQHPRTNLPPRQQQQRPKAQRLLPQVHQIV